MKRMGLLVCLALLVFSPGCVSHEKIVEKQLSSGTAQYVGMNTDELLLKKGPPDLKETLSTGEQLWTYRSTKAGTRKGWSMAVGNATPEPNIGSWRENVNFLISPEGIVRSYSVSVE